MDERDWLGDEPAPAKNVGGRPVSTGRGRYRKLSCDVCGFVAQATAASIDRLGEPPWSCPCGAGELTLPNYRDRAALLCDQARDEYAAASTELRAELRRELKRAGLDVDWFAGRSDFDAENYTLLPLGWLALLTAYLWVTDPRHRRTRAFLRALILPLYGLAIWLRIID